MSIKNFSKSEKALHALALGIGIALVNGGGISNLSMSLVFSALAYFDSKEVPKLSLTVGSLITMGHYMSPLMDHMEADKVLLASLPWGILAGILGYSNWKLSQKITSRYKATITTTPLLGLAYLVAYFIATSIIIFLV